MMESSTGNYSTTYQQYTAISDVPKALTVFVAAIMALLATIGTLGNTLVIVAVMAHKRLRNIHNIFIINLAAADLVVTLFVQPFAIVGAINVGRFLTKHDALCVTLGVSAVVSCTTSMVSIANIALDRYICICHNNIYHKMYKRFTVPFMVMGIWLYSFLLDLPNLDFIGWGEHRFNLKTRFCSFAVVNEGRKVGYIWIIFVFSWGISFGIISCCYSRLYLIVRRSRKAVTKKTKASVADKTSTGIKPADKRLLKVLGVIIILFIIMWTPFCILKILDRFVDAPHWLHFVSAHLCVANSSINFLVYAFNKDFREGYKLVFKTLACKSDIREGSTRIDMMNVTGSTS